MKNWRKMARVVYLLTVVWENFTELFKILRARVSLLYTHQTNQVQEPAWNRMQMKFFWLRNSGREEFHGKAGSSIGEVQRPPNRVRQKNFDGKVTRVYAVVA